jgi:hypothetical protein
MLGEGRPAGGLRVESDWHDILAFEAGWRTRGIRKERALRESFRISPARYYLLLDRLIDQPEALEYDPILVRRLRRLRERRRQARFVRRVDVRR